MVNSTEVFVALGVCVAVTGVIYIITLRKKREHEREQEVKRKQKRDSDKKEETVPLVPKTENGEVTKQPKSNNEIIEEKKTSIETKIEKEPVEITIKEDIKLESENLEFKIPELLAKICDELGNDAKHEVLVVEVSKEEVKADSNEFTLKLPESSEIIDEEPKVQGVKAEPIIENQVLMKSEAATVEAIKEEPKFESSASEALVDDIEVIEEKEAPKAPEVIAEAEKVDTENKVEPKIENEAVIVEAVKGQSNSKEVVNEVETETKALVETLTATEEIQAPVVNNEEPKAPEVIAEAEKVDTENKVEPKIVNEIVTKTEALTVEPLTATEEIQAPVGKNEEPKLETNGTTEKVKIEKVDIKEEPKSENKVETKSVEVTVEATKEEPKIESSSSEALGDDIEVITEIEVSEVPLVVSNNEEPKVEASQMEPKAENVETKQEQDVNIDNSAQAILQTIIKTEPSVNEVAAVSNNEEPKVETVETKKEQDVNIDNSAQAILQTIMKISSSVSEEAKVEIDSNETKNQEEIKTVEPIQEEKM
jgi:hypothetical protein